MYRGIIRVQYDKAYIRGKMSSLVGEVAVSIAQAERIATEGDYIIDISECRVIEIERLTNMAENNKVVVGAMRTCAVRFKYAVCSITNIKGKGYAWISDKIIKDIEYALSIHRNYKEAVDMCIRGNQIVYSAYMGAEEINELSQYMSDSYHGVTTRVDGRGMHRWTWKTPVQNISNDEINSVGG
jgi:hypothetical protein